MRYFLKNLIFFYLKTWPLRYKIFKECSGFCMGSLGLPLEVYMINFEEELKNFRPSLEVEEAEAAIYNRDLTDVTDIINEMMNEIKQNNRI